MLNKKTEKVILEATKEFKERYALEISHVGFDKNHVHFLCKFLPKYSGGQVIEVIKSMTAEEIFREIPEIKSMWGGEFWTDGYYIGTVSGKGNKEVIEQYIKSQGREKETDLALNYIPPSRITIWGKYSPGKLWVEPKVTLSSAHQNPGLLEIEVDGYVLLDMIVGYKASKNVTLMVIAQNLINQAYRASADEAGVDAPGRGFVFKIKYSF